MKKVGINTIIDYTNYGNRLQNLAVQEVLKSLGCVVETIVFEKNYYEQNNNLVNRLKRLSGSTPKQICEKIFSKINSYVGRKERMANLDKKRNAFKKFTSLYINERNYKISTKDVDYNLSEEYDFFVTGSDQVWNPIYRLGSPLDFLSFVSKEKRISYAASFGISKIPMEYKDNYKLWLSEMEYLSVREEVGSKIIKELTGRESAVLVDPTLMLDRDQWLSFSNVAINKPENNYLLTYFLGEVSKENKKLIKKIAIENNLEIVNLANLEDKRRYAADPGEFIDYINSSFVFFTDSFHGCVFSILLEKPFVVFDRIGNAPSMNSRIDTLLSTFKLGSRKWEEIQKSNEIFNKNYTHIPKILEYERKKAYQYLKEALNI